MNDEVVMAQEAARLGISVTQLRMRLACPDSLMAGIIADNRGRSIHDRSQTIPPSKRVPVEEVPVEPSGSGVSALDPDARRMREVDRLDAMVEAYSRRG